MEDSVNLALPYIMPSQAQKHVTHNEAIRRLDSLVMLSVIDRTTSIPPSGAIEGSRYIVAADAGGAWAGHEGEIAAWQDGAWFFLAPGEGWLSWCADEQSLLVFSEGGWRETGARADGFQNVPQLGVNAQADAINRLAVASEASLLSHAGGSHRLKINKNDATDIASVVFQSNFSGRAEIGLVGDDRLVFKVSADGSTFVEALSIDGGTGKPSFAGANLLEDYAVNLYQDSGRLAGNGTTAIIAPTFDWPNYLSLYNGSTVAPLAKFVHNNSDYGGPAGALEPAVKDLVEMIRDPTARRYGIEFWVASITQGSGTGGAVTVGGTTGYMNCFTTLAVRTPKHTFHAYVKALDASAILDCVAGQKAHINGIAHTAPVLIAPGDGWVSVTVHDSVDPRTSYGYLPSVFKLCGQTQGDRFLLACPALMGGLTKVDDAVGIIAGANSWPA